MRVPPPTQTIQELASELRAHDLGAVVGLWALRNGATHATAKELASRFGVDRKTLYAKCFRSFGCTAARMLARRRYLHTEYLQANGLSNQEIALLISYSSSAAVTMLLARGRKRSQRLR